MKPEHIASQAEPSSLLNQILHYLGIVSSATTQKIADDFGTERERVYHRLQTLLKKGLVAKARTQRHAVWRLRDE